MEKDGRSRKIRLLLISQATGGVQRHIVSLAKKLDKDRYSVTGVCPPIDLIRGVSRDKKSFTDELHFAGIRVYPISMRREINLLSDIVAFVRIFLFLRKNGFDIVHTHSSKAGFLGRIAARLAGVPVVLYTPNSFAFDRPNYMCLISYFYVLLERFANLFCDRIIAVCNREKEFAVKKGVCRAEKIEVIYNAIDTKGYISFADNKQVRLRFGIGEDMRVVTCVGRAAAQKAPFDFVTTSVRVHSRFSNVVFFFVGDGPLLKRLRRYVNESGYSEFIKITGWVDEPREIISICDIFVLTSLWEGLPYSLLDAMALSKPVVVTDTLGPGEIVVDGYNGFVVPRSKPALLAERIIGLLSLPYSELAKFGRNSRLTIERLPDLDMAVRQTQDLYERLLKEKGIM